MDQQHAQRRLAGCEESCSSHNTCIPGLGYLQGTGNDRNEDSNEVAKSPTAVTIQKRCQLCSLCLWENQCSSIKARNLRWNDLM